LLASQDQAAEHAHTDPRAAFAQLQDPARQETGTPPEMVSDSGLVLPAGGPPPPQPQPQPQPQEPQHGTRPDSGQHDGSVSWML
jgi:hypothetical protein